MFWMCRVALVSVGVGLNELRIWIRFGGISLVSCTDLNSIRLRWIRSVWVDVGSLGWAGLRWMGSA